MTKPGHQHRWIDLRTFDSGDEFPVVCSICGAETVFDLEGRELADQPGVI